MCAEVHHIHAVENAHAFVELCKTPAQETGKYTAIDKLKFETYFEIRTFERLQQLSQAGGSALLLLTRARWLVMN
jgi:hypothetical protein